MTKSTALCIVALLADMVEAYRHVAFSTDAEVAAALYDRIVRDLEGSWPTLEAHDRLPVALRRGGYRYGGERGWRADHRTR